MVWSTTGYLPSSLRWRSSTLCSCSPRCGSSAGPPPQPATPGSRPDEPSPDRPNVGWLWSLWRPQPPEEPTSRGCKRVTGDTPRVRLGVVGIISVSLFCTLFARLWYLQVMAAPDYAVAAQANQQRTMVEPAPRGRILDRNGIVLVDNRISTVLTINSQIFDGLSEDDQARVLTRVAE